MTYDSLSLSEVIPAPPERIYAAWLSSDEHTAFTGDKAVVEPFVGGTHSTFDGYAIGRTVELQPGRRIVQTWRAEDFPLGSPDSRVEVTLEETVGGTMLTILHTEIPSGQGTSCRDGWVKFYLEPLKGYFVAAKTKTNGVRMHAPSVVGKTIAGAAKVQTKPRTKAARRPLGREPRPSLARPPGRSRPPSNAPRRSARRSSGPQPSARRPRPRLNRAASRARSPRRRRAARGARKKQPSKR